ncbi:hypothetical protein P5V15_012786 [Pogonomyrmex californicus]
MTLARGIAVIAWRFGISSSIATISADNATLALRRAIVLFQEYYRIPGNGVLNDATLKQMRKPRCGIKYIEFRLRQVPEEMSEDALHLELSPGERERPTSHRDVGGKFVVDVRARFDES